ncbi:MAG: hypothetical protein Q9209_007872 [Squamulea sp. 1 TL-2023]
MSACGWNVIVVFDGVSNVKATVYALADARAKKIEGQAPAHGAPLGEEGVASVKRRFGMNLDEHFKVDHDFNKYFHDVPVRGSEYEAQFEQKFRAMDCKMVDDWHKYIPLKEDFAMDKFPSRKAAAHIFATLAKNLNTFTVGTVDLRPAVNMSWEGHEAFQDPDLRTVCGLSGVTSGFFMFYVYGAAGVRMGAIQSLQAIHIATHDSIALRDDGPAHQPIELLALFRAMPNLLHIRLCDWEETCGAFTVALGAKTTPTMISLSRHALTQYPQQDIRIPARRVME